MIQQFHYWVFIQKKEKTLDTHTHKKHSYVYCSSITYHSQDMEAT